MVRHRRAWLSWWGMLAIVAAPAGVSHAQQAVTSPVAPRPAAHPQQERPEVIMTRALRANPLTAPYSVGAYWKDGVVVLAGRVGTKQVHDAAVQMAIAFGFRFRDDLVIDTAATLRAAMSSTPSMTGYGALAPNLSAAYYVYPQPLLGWLDDPFFGMEPPVVSYAPWVRNRMMLPAGRPGGPGGPGAGLGGPGGPVRGGQAGPAAGAGTAPTAAAAAWGQPGAGTPQPDPARPQNQDGESPAIGAAPAGAPAGLIAAGAPPAGSPDAAVMGLPPAKGDIEITVDANGQVFLRGVVASEEVAREIEQTAWSVPGVSRVFTQFQVRPRRSEKEASEEPPPLPQPVAPQAEQPLMVPPRPDPNAAHRHPEEVPPPPQAPDARPKRSDLLPEPPQPGRVIMAPQPPAREIAVVALDRQQLTRRVVDSLKRRKTLAALPIEVRATADAIMLSGKVPSVYEAMLAYRAAQQTPGVREVIDGLEFLVPDEDHPNPLIRRGRPEDMEPYLRAQMTRHLGDLAHIDEVKARGDHLEIRGSLLDAADKDRVQAILRSIPVLHGFTLDTTLTAD